MCFPLTWQYYSPKFSPQRHLELVFVCQLEPFKFAELEAAGWSRGGAGWQWGKHENTTQRSTKYHRADLQMWPNTSHNLHHTQATHPGGRSQRYCSSCGSRWPDPTPCCSDLVIGCLLLWQQSRATASHTRITESSETGPGMTQADNMHKNNYSQCHHKKSRQDKADLLCNVDVFS